MRATLAFWLAAQAAHAARALELDADALRRLAERRLRALLGAARRAPFHAERLRAAGVSRRDAVRSAELAALLAALPPITKREMREAGMSVLDGGRPRSAWFRSRSSGSTGEPFEMYYDARAWALLKHLVKLRARAACGMRADDRIALLDAVGVEQTGRSLVERMGRVRRISVLQPAERVAAELVAFRPDTIYALPSSLIDAGRALRVMGAIARPRRIFTSGELLSGAMRSVIGRAFGCPVLDVYGTSETKEIAWECAAGGRHINADVVHVEVLDDSLAPVAAGEEGELVVTLLVNHAMPLLRYRTGDRGALLEGRCACGRHSPLLGIVSGREADALELADGTRRSPYALTLALERVPELLQYQVVQLAADRLLVRAIVRHGAQRESVAYAVRDALRAAVHPELRVHVEFVDRLTRGPRAKLRVVQPLTTRGAREPAPLAFDSEP